MESTKQKTNKEKMKFKLKENERVITLDNFPFILEEGDKIEGLIVSKKNKGVGFIIRSGHKKLLEEIMKIKILINENGK